MPKTKSLNWKNELVFADYNKILVIGGFGDSDIDTSDVEIVDLESSKSNCQKLPVFPYVTHSGVAGIDLIGQPFACRGHGQQCFALSQQSRESRYSTVGA